MVLVGLEAHGAHLAQVPVHPHGGVGGAVRVARPVVAFPKSHVKPVGPEGLIKESDERSIEVELGLEQLPDLRSSFGQGEIGQAGGIIAFALAWMPTWEPTSRKTCRQPSRLTRA